MHTPFFNTLRLHKLGMLTISPSSISVTQSFMNSQRTRCQLKCTFDSFTLKGDFIYHMGLMRVNKHFESDNSVHATIFIDFAEVPSQMCEYIGARFPPILFSRMRYQNDSVVVVERILTLMYEYCKKTGLGL